jgi:hypothetical protein
VAPSALARARDCAVSAGGQSAAPPLLAEGVAGFSNFQAAFAACMVKADAAEAVGSLTLWVDTYCNW